MSGCAAGYPETTEQANDDGATSTVATDIPEIPEEPEVLEKRKEVQDTTMNLQIGERRFKATLAKNSSAEALEELLARGPITINMQDYENMEKVGSLRTSLPTNDEQISMKPGDLILYQGDAFVIYYAPNSWNFTRMGRIDDVTQAEPKEAPGSGGVTVTLSLE